MTILLIMKIIASDNTIEQLQQERLLAWPNIHGELRHSNYSFNFYYALIDFLSSNFTHFPNVYIYNDQTLVTRSLKYTSMQWKTSESPARIRT